MLYNIQNISTKEVPLWGKNDILSYFNKECKTAEELRERAELRLQLEKEMKSMNFPDTISFILGKFNIKITEITNVPGDSECLSYRTFLRYKNSEIKVLSKRNVIAVCVSLGIPSFISNHVIENAGFSFGNTFEDSMFKIILETNVHETFESINKMLVLNGLDPLTKKKS